MQWSVHTRQFNAQVMTKMIITDTTAHMKNDFGCAEGCTAADAGIRSCRIQSGTTVVFVRNGNDLELTTGVPLLCELADALTLLSSAVVNDVVGMAGRSCVVPVWAFGTSTQSIPGTPLATVTGTAGTCAEGTTGSDSACTVTADGSMTRCCQLEPPSTA